MEWNNGRMERAINDPVPFLFVLCENIDNRGGGGIGNACTKYGDATAHARHGTPPFAMTLMIM